MKVAPINKKVAPKKVATKNKNVAKVLQAKNDYNKQCYICLSVVQATIDSDIDSLKHFN